MLQKQNKNLIKGVEKLLNQQTTVILSAVDEKLKESEERVNKKIIFAFINYLEKESFTI